MQARVRTRGVVIAARPCRPATRYATSAVISYFLAQGWREMRAKELDHMEG
jgi:hypothetical protein